MISVHRYYELKHFCLQYPEWVSLMCHEASNNGSTQIVKKTVDVRSGSPERIIENMEQYKKRIDLIRNTAEITSKKYWHILLYSVAFGVGYSNICSRFGNELSEGEFKKIYLAFFNNLDSARN